jgi:hypothetical protein
MTAVKVASRDRFSGGRQARPFPQEILSDQADIRRIARAPSLEYPIATKAEFVAQLSQAGSVAFRDTEYDATVAAELIPAFFFPLRSAEELVNLATELLVARGLAPGPNGANPGQPLDEAQGHRDASTQSADVIARIEQAVAQLPDGNTDVERIHALDVITHALDFVHHPHGLRIWREALWERRLHPDACTALESMLEHLRSAVARGDVHAASEICDCLEDLINPDVAPRQRVGGLQRTGATRTTEV